MDLSKSWLASKTVWAGIIGAVAWGIQLSGFQIDPNDQAALVNNILGAVGILSSLIAIYGRVVATKKINWVKKADEDKQGASR